MPAQSEPEEPPGAWYSHSRPQVGNLRQITHQTVNTRACLWTYVMRVRHTSFAAMGRPDGSQTFRSDSEWELQ